jgi:hypothetical protein
LGDAWVSICSAKKGQPAKDRGNTFGQVVNKRRVWIPAPAEALMLKQLVASTEEHCLMKAGLGFWGGFFELGHLLHW